MILGQSKNITNNLEKIIEHVNKSKLSKKNADLFEKNILRLFCT